MCLFHLCFFSFSELYGETVECFEKQMIFKNLMLKLKGEEFDQRSLRAGQCYLMSHNCVAKQYFNGYVLKLFTLAKNLVSQTAESAN